MSIVVLKRKSEQKSKSNDVKYNPSVTNNIVKKFHNTYQYNHFKSDNDTNNDISKYYTLSQSQHLQKIKQCVPYVSTNVTYTKKDTKNCSSFSCQTVKNVSTMSSSERLQMRYKS